MQCLFVCGMKIDFDELFCKGAHMNDMLKLREIEKASDFGSLINFVNSTKNLPYDVLRKFKDEYKYESFLDFINRTDEETARMISDINEELHRLEQQGISTPTASLSLHEAEERRQIAEDPVSKKPNPLKTMFDEATQSQSTTSQKGLRV